MSDSERVCRSFLGYSRWPMREHVECQGRVDQHRIRSTANAVNLRPDDGDGRWPVWQPYKDLEQ